MHVACDGGIVSHLSTDTLTSGVEQGRTAGCYEEKVVQRVVLHS